MFHSPRGHDVFVGTLEGVSGSVEVAAVHTGMGSPSVDIIVSELIFRGVRRFIRVGTAGTLQPTRVKLHDVVIATAAVRDEGTSRRYAPVEFPAVATPDLVRALSAAADRLALGRYVHCGIVHSKDSLFAREFESGPLTAENKAYMRLMRRLGVLASEMEAAHLFVLAHAHSLSGADHDQWRPIEAAAIMGIVGEEEMAPRRTDSGEARAIAIALEAVRNMNGEKPVAKRRRRGN